MSATQAGDCTLWPGIFNSLKGLESTTPQPACCSQSPVMNCSSSNEITGINLSGSQLSGTIPPQIGGLSKLATLVLSENTLGGVLPPQMGDLTSLTYLDLSRNQLTGAIPSELSQTKLQTLLLPQNRFNGPLPNVIRTMPSIRFIQADASVLNNSTLTTRTTATSRAQTSTRSNLVQPTTLMIAASTTQLAPTTNSYIPDATQVPQSGGSNISSDGTGMVVGGVVFSVLFVLVFGGLGLREYFLRNKQKENNDREFFYMTRDDNLVI